MLRTVIYRFLESLREQVFISKLFDILWNIRLSTNHFRLQTLVGLVKTANLDSNIFTKDCVKYKKIYGIFVTDRWKCQMRKISSFHVTQSLKEHTCRYTYIEGQKEKEF